MGIADNIAAIEERITQACERSGRKRDEITLLAVSKFHSREAVTEAWKGGVRFFGENRVQEAETKFAGFTEGHAGTELHMIGALQRNKAKTAALLFDCIQSVDRESLIHELGKHCTARSAPLPVLLELHTGEASKSGFPDEQSLFKAAETLLAYPGLAIRGLMTIAPFSQDEKVIRNSFRTLVRAQNALESRFPPAFHPACSWACLSMGMSGDFEIAIEEGSTLLRIGTSIFGERSK
ncbi:MAG: YggS family pyridoxal phosphate-dependent enzyme [Treponema sp.]|jgi:pyridoxal phosphate enzyme (YggS family)|nr:YggS family pyridoxal phosphate-dependent enzyme [Treponema sp.]